MFGFGFVLTRHLQMTDFVSGDDDARESTSIFDDGHTVDFLETFVNDTGSSNVSESWLGYRMVIINLKSVDAGGTKKKTERVARIS